MRKRRSSTGPILLIVFLLGLTIAVWNNGSYFIPVMLTTIAVVNLFRALLRGKRKKITSSFALAILLIGIALSIVFKFIPGIILSFLAYIVVRWLLQGLQGALRPGGPLVHTHPTNVKETLDQPYQAPYTAYTQGYQANGTAKNARPDVEPYHPYQPSQTRKSASTTTQFEQPQVEYPQELPPR